MLHRLPFRAMGCEMLAILDQDSEAAPAALDLVPRWFEDWEQTLSRFRADSELSRLNRAHRPVQVGSVLWDVFRAALAAEESTGGLVTPTVMDAVIEAGYDRSYDSLPFYNTDNTTAPTLLEVNPLASVMWDEPSRTIFLPEGLRLDFGGVAKGWAAHQASERLKADGPALMNAGGDIAISGARANGEPWAVGVKNPFDPATDLEVLYLNRCGVATSGKDRRRWVRDGILHHHIIDPHTGLPAETDVMTATVVAPTVMEAEAAAKAVLILGSREGLAWLETRPELAGLLILEDGQLIYSQKMNAYL